MERIAVVADIHANIYALQVFMDYIDGSCPVSQILNLGDFIQIGPNPTEVFDIVMNDSRFINIMGNSEYMFFNPQIKEQYQQEARHQEWVCRQLGNQRMDQLKQVPLRHIHTVEEKRLLMVHSRLNSVVDSPLIYNGNTLGEFIADYDVDTDYILIGHTHLPLYIQHWNNKPIINPGSIGCGKDGIARFAILEIDHGIVNVNYRQLRYGKEQLILDYNKYDVPCREKFIHMFF